MIEGKSLRSDLHHLDRALQALQQAMLQACGGAAAGWMAPLPLLIAEVDEYLDDEEAPALAVERDLHARAERLLGPQPPSDAVFRTQYDALRAAHPAVASAHEALLHVMAQLPAHPMA
ncbi:hypothetical protein GCM10027277_07160 [Pseudoduganella ginsengisoli]|uniref:DUF4404 family protein n=1 Tax=Pseudoduganella ginsengisoli TaxID=1462440 RepID=A0A6L6Q7G2_9BURK|nr:hypothetical protein [Pseudoduganella ginsengisoli]MTW05221.1 hypothetical protein [Pseudoduganella ginsengisoli]